MANPVYAILWLLVLIFISFWLAFLCGGIYIVLYVLEVCIPALSKINEVLLQGVQFPHFCAQAMMECKPLF